ncbi:MAG TPA: hypothetical protein VMV07_19300 [Streptosporangiaceae bacterium]|nr:hypothetical protein [Streptosporangiaceae bacterium]
MAGNARRPRMAADGREVSRLLSEEELRGMSRAERLGLLRALVALDNSEQADRLVGRRRRAVVLIASIACCIALAAWIAVLALTLPRYYRAGGWRGAWVGFDFALLVTFAVTGWAAWRRRQVLVICLVVLATLLCCDAWFDVMLDAHTKGFEFSLLSALVVELPLAALAITGARLLLRRTVAVVRRYEGQSGPAPRLREARLVGGNPGAPLWNLFRESAEFRSDSCDPPGETRPAEPPGRAAS